MATGKIPAPGWTLVWTNPNPTSSFAEQTLSLNLSGYTWVKILFRRETNNAIIAAEVEVPIDGETQIVASGLADASNHLGRRIVDYASSSGIRFQGGNKYNSYAAVATQDNSVLLPYKIYAR